MMLDSRTSSLPYSQFSLLQHYPAGYPLVNRSRQASGLILNLPSFFESVFPSVFWRSQLLGKTFGLCFSPLKRSASVSPFPSPNPLSYLHSQQDFSMSLSEFSCLAIYLSRKLLSFYPSQSSFHEPSSNCLC